MYFPENLSNFNAVFNQTLMLLPVENLTFQNFATIPKIILSIIICCYHLSFRFQAPLQQKEYKTGKNTNQINNKKPQQTKPKTSRNYNSIHPTPPSPQNHNTKKNPKPQAMHA